MEAKINAKNKVVVADHTVKKEQTHIDDDEENTPLRDEKTQTGEPIAADAREANWETDEEDRAKTPPPPTIGQSITKRSDSSDSKLIDIEESFLDDLLDAPLVKKEERPELQLEFLDSITESDLEGSTGQNNLSNQNDLNSMDLEPTQKKTSNFLDEAEIEAQINKREKKLEKLNKSEKKKEKNIKKKDAHKKRRRSRSRSPTFVKERRTTKKINPSGRITTSTNSIKNEPDELELVPVRESEKRVKLININKLLESVPAKETFPILTIKQKRQLAVKRVTEVLNTIRRESTQTNEEFLVVDTIGNLPSTEAFMNTDIFENPSPLCNNLNVMYNFNSTTLSNVDLGKWGLVALPSVTRRLLRLIGIDALRLRELQHNSKMVLQKLRKQEEAKKDKFEPCSTGLYKSVSTQTERQINLNTRDTGVQVMTQSHNGVYWLDSNFNGDDLTQQQSNVMLALKELCATMPCSSMWADELFKALKTALKVKRAEKKERPNNFKRKIY